MSEELKPCPLCKGEVKHRRNRTTSWDIKCARTVWCIDCNCGLAYFGTMNEMALAWNTRPSPWIKITPETMPEIMKSYFISNRNVHNTIKTGLAFLNSDRHWAIDNKYVDPDYYMPIPEQP